MRRYAMAVLAVVVLSSISYAGPLRNRIQRFFNPLVPATQCPGGWVQPAVAAPVPIRMPAVASSVPVVPQSMPLPVEYVASVIRPVAGQSGTVCSGGVCRVVK